MEAQGKSNEVGLEKLQLKKGVSFAIDSEKYETVLANAADFQSITKIFQNYS
tara:strand:+ start:2111 stop:2266 length:156 start_codon:yes stop_codon:yes gene_type:complete